MGAKFRVVSGCSGLRSRCCNLSTISEMCAVIFGKRVDSVLLEVVIMVDGDRVYVHNIKVGASLRSFNVV